MADIVNSIHISPGVYATETVDMKAAANSIGITKLAVVGETLRGPAFQPYWIHSPKEYASVFGGTSTEKYKGSNYPKYELPYVANEFLKAGTELCVVKTLGLSGYNAGPAWVVTGEKSDSDEKVVIAVLRSRGYYGTNPDYATQEDENGCLCETGKDMMHFVVGEKLTLSECDEPLSYNMEAVSISEYHDINDGGTFCSEYALSSNKSGFSVSPNNLGRFTINCVVGPSDENVETTSGFVKNISVSFNKDDKDYILNVLGTSNDDGDMPLYVETFYDVAWKDYVENQNFNTISSALTKYNVAYISDYSGLKPVDGILTKHDSELTRSDVGKRYLCVESGLINNISLDYSTNSISEELSEVFAGHVYTVLFVNDENGVRKIAYTSYSEESTSSLIGDEKIYAQDKLLNTSDSLSKKGTIVYNKEDDLYYRLFNTYNKYNDDVLQIDTVPLSGVGLSSYSGSTYTINLSEIFSGETLPNPMYIQSESGFRGIRLYEVNYDNLVYNYEELSASDYSRICVNSGDIGMPQPDYNIPYRAYKLPKGSGRLRFRKDYGTQTSSYAVFFSHGPINDLTDAYSAIVSTASGEVVTKQAEIGQSGSTGFVFDGSSGYTHIYVPEYCKNWPQCSELSILGGQKSCNPEIVPFFVQTNELVGTKRLLNRNSEYYWEVDKNKKYQIYNGDGKYNVYYYLTSENAAITCDINNYKTRYRYSSTPWIVSNVKGDAKNIEVNKMFRFHTISDGAESVSEVKVSIENIRPDSGEFDVVVRDYNDTDASTSVLEAFRGCTMKSGKNSIAYRIGTFDGSYESKSKFITVEVNESSSAMNGVPAGFLGYSIPNYSGIQVGYPENKNVTMPSISYNKWYNEDISKKKQYFGLSDITGYDVDFFTFKGNMSTLEDPGFVTHCFHLDSRMNEKSYAGGNAPSIKVDGVEGYIFDTVDINSRTNTTKNVPIIDTEANMHGSIFEDVKLRKFTVMFAGGFDGWDAYRDQRTNTNDYSYISYKAALNKMSGIGRNFDLLEGANYYDIEGNAITSDYYATLAGVSLLKNPEDIDINLLATPGIDTINNTQLVSEIFNLIEDRADTFYIVNTPDKYSGSEDYVEDIPDVDDIVDDFTYNEMYSDNAATYYPWVKIEDKGEYVWVSPTRDVVRNLAESDNTNTTMNLAPAGTSRGKVDAIRARKNLKNAESDTLYDANINPVRTYAQNGLVVMGQKTLRKEDDIMNRIDVRRMVLRMRKLIAIGCLGLIFEPYDNAVVQSFKSIITGIMQVFVDNRAVEKWSMDIDDSQEMRDRLELSAVIYVKPIRALEYITLNFVVTNNDVYFEA